MSRRRSSLDARPRPFRIHYEQEDAGRNIKASKKKIRWVFGWTKPGERDHEVMMKHSLVSGKKEIFEDGHPVTQISSIAITEFAHGWTSNGYIFRIEADSKKEEKDVYSLSIDGIPFERWMDKTEAMRHMAEQVGAYDETSDSVRDRRSSGARDSGSFSSTAANVPNSRPSSAVVSSFDPFSSNAGGSPASDPFAAPAVPAAPASEATSSFDPFGAPAAPAAATSATSFDPFAAPLAGSASGFDAFGADVSSVTTSNSAGSFANFDTSAPAVSSDPFAAGATAPQGSDVFGAPERHSVSSTSGFDPFSGSGTPSAASSDPFASANSDPFAASSSTGALTSDPFGAPPPPTPASSDPFGAPPTPTPASSDPFGAPPTPTPASSDPFGAPTPPSSDPFAATSASTTTPPPAAAAATKVSDVMDAFAGMTATPTTSGPALVIPSPVPTPQLAPQQPQGNKTVFDGLVNLDLGAAPSAAPAPAPSNGGRRMSLNMMMGSPDASNQAPAFTGLSGGAMGATPSPGQPMMSSPIGMDPFATSSPQAGGMGMGMGMGMTNSNRNSMGNGMGNLGMGGANGSMGGMNGNGMGMGGMQQQQHQMQHQMQQQMPAAAANNNPFGASPAQAKPNTSSLDSLKW